MTNEIVSYTVKDNMKISLSMDVIDQLNIKDLSPLVYIHSDRGVHYTVKAFRELLQKRRQGNPCQGVATAGIMRQWNHFSGILKMN